MSKYNYTLTTDEDQVLLDMIQFFDDLGLPDHIDSKALSHYPTSFSRTSNDQRNAIFM